MAENKITPRKALLYQKLGGSRVQCRTCQWKCKINPGKYGVCRMRQNIEGELYVMNYNLASSAAVDPIEKKPLFHFFPSTMVFSLGTWGCNFHCLHCQNWQISCVGEEAVKDNSHSQTITPEMAVELTKQYHCRGISWTYNEPTVWFEYTLDSAKLAHQNNLYTVYVTNGYVSEEALDAIGPYLDAYRVDIKGFSDKVYRELAKIRHWRGILEVAERARKKWNMHVEVVTNIIPTMNDDDEQLTAIANWIKEKLGELTPWHITRFFPHYQLSHLPPTPVETIEHACDIGKKAGLKFIYVGNITGHQGENTRCYSCHKVAVKRLGFQSQVVNLKNSHCKSCDADLNFRTDIKKIEGG